MVPNQDIGFIEVGQRAAVKVRTFDFTKYGLLEGVVESVSMDAIKPDPTRDLPDGRSPDSMMPGSAGATQDPVYAARISLDRSQIKVGEKVVNLAPGMAVTVEIMTGERTIISYLLSPLSRHSHESMRER